jgi:hypothetical protein
MAAISARRDLLWSRDFAIVADAADHPLRLRPATVEVVVDCFRTAPSPDDTCATRSSQVVHCRYTRNEITARMICTAIAISSALPM